MQLDQFGRRCPRRGRRLKTARGELGGQILPPGRGDGRIAETPPTLELFYRDPDSFRAAPIMPIERSKPGNGQMPSQSWSQGQRPAMRTCWGVGHERQAARRLSGPAGESCGMRRNCRDSSPQDGGGGWISHVLWQGPTIRQREEPAIERRVIERTTYFGSRLEIEMSQSARLEGTISDKTLWERRAFEKQLINILPDLRAFARFLVQDRTEADDLVQDTVTRALRAFEQFDLKTDVKAWTFTILRNVRFNSFRKVRLSSLEDEPDTRAVQANQHDSLELREVLSALSTLSQEHREVIALVRGKGLEYEEAAAVLGCPIGTIKSRLNRADAALRKAVGDQWEWMRSRDHLARRLIDAPHACPVSGAGDRRPGNREWGESDAELQVKSR